MLGLATACGSEPAEPEAPGPAEVDPGASDPSEPEAAPEEPPQQQGKSVEQQALEAIERARASTPKTALSFFRPPDPGLRVERLDVADDAARRVVDTFVLPDDWELPESGAVVRWSGFVSVPSTDVWAVTATDAATVRVTLAEERLVATNAPGDPMDAGAVALAQGWHALSIEWEPAPGETLPRVRLAPMEGTWRGLDALELAR